MKDLDNIKVDIDLIWEVLYGYEKNLFKLYKLIREEMNDLIIMFNQHESKDKVFKNQLIETHKRNYDSFEELYKSNRKLWESASKRKGKSYNEYTI